MSSSFFHLHRASPSSFSATSTSWSASSPTTTSSPLSTAPSTTTVEESYEAGEEEKKKANDDEDEEEEKDILLPNCRLGRSGTLIQGIRPDSPFPSNEDNYDNYDDDDDVVYVKYLSNHGLRGRSGTATPTPTPTPRGRQAIFRRRNAMSAEKMQLQPLRTLWEDDDGDVIKDGGDSGTKSLGGKGVSRLRFERGGNAGAVDAAGEGEGASPGVGVERRDVVKGVEEAGGKRRRLRRFVMLFAKMGAEKK